MGDRKVDPFLEKMRAIADLVSEAAAQDNRSILEKALKLSHNLVKDFASGAPGAVDRNSETFVWGVHDMVEEIARCLRSVFLPDDAQELARTHVDVLRAIRAKPAIQHDELARWLPDASLATDKLYDKCLIEPVASPPAGMRLTFAGERAIRLIDAGAPSPSAGMQAEHVQPTAKSSSETVQKLDQVLRQCEEIEASTRSLFDLGRSAAQLCAAIDSQFGFHFSAVQLARRDENTIETVAGTGIAKDWVGLAKHRLEEQVSLRDIQADIFMERRVEVIHGRDDPKLGRLDPFIGKIFHHEDLVRVFVPLVLIRDADGQILTDVQVWEPVGDNRSGCELFQLRPDPGRSAKVIGTVEAGFKAVGKRPRLSITPDLAEGLANFVTRHSSAVYQNTLTHVLERVAEMALRLAKSDIGTVQWGTVGENKEVHWQTVGRGRGAQTLLDRGENVIGAIGGSPRKDGLGMQALKAGQPKYLGKGLKDYNPSLYEQGIRAMAAYPSAMASDLAVGQRVCLIYTHFREERVFADEELRWVHHLARRSGDLLPMAFDLAAGRDHQRQLETMQNVVSMFSDRNRHKTVEDLLSFIAWSTLNLHGADIVTIYRSDPKGNGRLLAPPTRAGRLRDPEDIDVEAKDTDAPMLVLGWKGAPLFISRVIGNEILDPHRAPHGFVARERIVSSAALPLVVRGDTTEDVVGVMFVNYREFHEFTADERSRLTTLTSLSATALKNFYVTDAKLVGDAAISALLNSYLAGQVKRPARKPTPLKNPRRPTTD